MHTHHLHSGIEEEDAASEHKIVELCEVREKALGHVHIVMTSACDVDKSQDDQQSGGDDCADHSAPFADLSDPVQAFEGNEGRHPIYGQDCYQSEYLVGRQCSIRCSVQTYVSE